MDIVSKGNMKVITIRPGEYYVSRDNVVISTLLGSCVSACLYDPINRVVGMNHFLLSNRRYSKSMPMYITEAGRYGVNAMELVINGMLNLGAKRENLRAKTCGGSSLLRPPGESDSFFCVGEVNCRFVVEFLKNDGIPVVASNMGGDRGRIVRFSSGDFSVLIRKIRTSGMPKLVKDEKQFWLKSIESQEKKCEEPDLWV
ncbi:MAG: chemotaxis protein CheD [Syntrophus sp. (in: bacteria)]|nr:chemotaxis protein CheD [Syntrophus sp. (in: bacteria)]